MAVPCASLANGFAMVIQIVLMGQMKILPMFQIALQRNKTALRVSSNVTMADASTPPGSVTMTMTVGMEVMSTKIARTTSEPVIQSWNSLVKMPNA